MGYSTCNFKMLAEKDLLRGMKAAKELELWRSMKVTIDQNHGNTNSPSVQAILSQIKLVAADDEDPLEQLKLQKLGASSGTVSVPYHPILPPRETRIPNAPVDHQITKIKPSPNTIPTQYLSTMGDIKGREIISDLVGHPILARTGDPTLGRPTRHQTGHKTWEDSLTPRNY